MGRVLPTDTKPLERKTLARGRRAFEQLDTDDNDRLGREDLLGECNLIARRIPLTLSPFI